jgi:hypothetical protein
MATVAEVRMSEATYQGRVNCSRTTHQDRTGLSQNAYFLRALMSS